MPVHERRADRGARLAQVLTRKLGQELSAMRRQAGLSQAAIAREIGIDPSAVSRIETGTVVATTLEVYAQLFAVVGGRLSVKVYPEGDPLRDAAQLALIERLCRLLHAAISVMREVPITAGDLRAWDVMLRVGAAQAGVEAETILDDLQALERKIALKQLDSGVEVVILIIAGTERNRRILRAHREALRARFPLDTREALGYLRNGQLPPQNAIILI